MFRLIVLIFIAASVRSAMIGLLPRPKLDGRIVGGYAINITDAPYQISLMRRGRHICGGTLISKNIVMSAAHCTYRQNASDYLIRMGSTTIGEGGQVVNVTELINHPQYNPRTIDYDFSILKLEDYEEQDDVSDIISESNLPVLPEEGDDVKDGTDLLVSGWGNTQNSMESSNSLRAVSVEKYNQRRCNRAYLSFGGVTARMICAGFMRGGKDACQGDSGGPLVNTETNTLVGVVSWGYGCATPGYPGVYSRVSSVRKWIEEQSGL